MNGICSVVDGYASRTNHCIGHRPEEQAGEQCGPKDSSDFPLATQTRFVPHPSPPVFRPVYIIIANAYVSWIRGYRSGPSRPCQGVPFAQQIYSPTERISLTAKSLASPLFPPPRVLRYSHLVLDERSGTSPRACVRFHAPSRDKKRDNTPDNGNNGGGMAGGTRRIVRNLAQTSAQTPASSPNKPSDNSSRTAPTTSARWKRMSAASGRRRHASLPIASVSPPRRPTLRRLGAWWRSPPSLLPCGYRAIRRRNGRVLPHQRRPRRWLSRMRGLPASPAPTGDTRFPSPAAVRRTVSRRPWER